MVRRSQIFFHIFANMKLEMEKILFTLPCDECSNPIFNEAYRITETFLRKFGEKPHYITKRICKDCFNIHYPGYKELLDNQLDMFDG